MDGEISNDNPILIAKDNYRINIFNVVYDQVISSLNERFSEHGKLFKTISIINSSN